jgi:hypothetical protein
VNLTGSVVDIASHHGQILRIRGDFHAFGEVLAARKVYVGMMEFGVKVRDDDFGTWAAAEFIDLISVIAELEMHVPVRVAQAGRDYGYSYRNLLFADRADIQRQWELALEIQTGRAHLRQCRARSVQIKQTTLEDGGSHEALGGEIYRVLQSRVTDRTATSTYARRACESTA